jgi:hypothetical protein
MFRYEVPLGDRVNHPRGYRLNPHGGTGQTLPLVQPEPVQGCRGNQKNGKRCVVGKDMFRTDH